MLGNVGQTNYGGANGFLDGFATRAHGANERVVLSINWGAWDVGMYARETGGRSRGASGMIGAQEAGPLLEAAWA